MQSEEAGSYENKQEGPNLHFNKTYIKNDHFQKSITNPTISIFAQRIKAYFEHVKHPLKILDLCCGYGEPTFDLYQTLIREKVEIEKVTGYDLSADQIGIAKQKYVTEEKLHFQQKDIEQLNQDQGVFDVVTSFFGLHWVVDLEKVAKMIRIYLKPKGLFQAIIPIQIHDLYDFRVDFMENSRWKECLDQKIRKPNKFRHQSSAYQQAFEKHFSTVHGQTKDLSFKYNRIEFRTIMESWFPEVRHLIKDQWFAVKKDVITKAYLNQFVDSIPERQSGNVVKKSQSEFVLNHPIYFYQGEKKEQI